MIAASFLYVMLIATEKLIVLKCMEYRRVLRYLARTVFVMILVATAISRMYFATHFLHQCIFGAVLGISISETLMFLKFIDRVQKMEKRQWFTVVCSMAAVVASIFWLHKLLTGNPMASVHLVGSLSNFSHAVEFQKFRFQAFKYCSDPLYPKPETTVMFSSIRSIAKIVGLMLAAPLTLAAPSGLKLNRARSIPFAIFLMIIHWQLIVYTPKQFKLLIFYAYTFIVYAIFQFLFLSAIPKLCAQKLEKPKEN